MGCRLEDKSSKEQSWDLLEKPDLRGRAIVSSMEKTGLKAEPSCACEMNLWEKLDFRGLGEALREVLGDCQNGRPFWEDVGKSLEEPPGRTWGV